MLFGNVFQRIVGRIYTSPDGTLVKISHLTFWGNRRDVVLLTEDLVTLGDYDHTRSLYLTIGNAKVPGELYCIPLRTGGILDDTLVKEILKVNFDPE